MPTFYKKFANSKPMPPNTYLTAGVGEHGSEVRSQRSGIKKAAVSYNA